MRFDTLTIDGQVITIAVAARQKEATCPHCGQAARRVHSRYIRTLADLPCAGRTVRLQLGVRRFICANPACEHQTFTERLPDVVAPWAQRSQRLAETQRGMGLALGGEAAARRLVQLGMPISPDTVLRLIKQDRQPTAETPHVLGVDDFAWTKHQTYGTILVDLEQHRVIDLLPDRAADSLAAWLQQHPGVQVIARDRAGSYADGARRGAPEAVQVADRWHLLANLREALERLTQRKHAHLPRLARPVTIPTPTDSAAETTASPAEVSDATPEAGSPTAAAAVTLSKAEQLRQNRRARRLSRYDEIIRLQAEGHSVRSIARQMGMGRQTIRRYLRNGSFPEIARRKKRRSLLDPFEPYLLERWQAGCHNAMQLWREIREQGYRGSRPLMSHWAAQLRKTLPKSERGSRSRIVGEKAPTSVAQDRRRCSPVQAAWLLVKPAADLDEQEQAALDSMQEECREIATAYPLAQDFAVMVRERQSASLADWLQSAQECGVAELRGFARGLQRDLAAVTAGLSMSWSSGQVEGQVNRLKMVKRTMYGKAGFDLLRQRILTPT